MARNRPGQLNKTMIECKFFHYINIFKKNFWIFCFFLKKKVKNEINEVQIYKEMCKMRISNLMISKKVTTL